MNTKQFILSAAAISSTLLLSQCKKDEHHKNTKMFKVSIENVQEPKMFFASGVFDTPVGESAAGPAVPGKSFVFSFHAGKGHKLSFTTMFGRSNDLFFGPDGNGIALYNGDTPVSGDITDQIKLWDAGTEVNEAPGMGMYQAPTQPAPNTGPSESDPVQEISMVNDGFTYPSVASTLKVTIANDGNTMFTVTIDNLPGSFTPISPGAWVIHTNADPIFTAGMPDRGMGLESQAEDGNPTTLAAYLADNSGLVTPLSPGVWAVHKAGTYPLFKEGMLDYGEGLEMLAESADPTTLAASLLTKPGVKSSGVFNTPVGASGPGPILPGNKYEFTIEAAEDDYLSFATMFGQSNDSYYAFSDKGVALWHHDDPLWGDQTSKVKLWDVGTEVNEYPGAGLHQPARGTGGTDESENVMEENDGFPYPATPSVIKVTVTPL